MGVVKQGSAAIGLRSKTQVVLACVNKANFELSSYHIGVAIAGLTADGRVLSRYMRSECINYNYTFESPLPIGRIVVQLADKAQVIASSGTKKGVLFLANVITQLKHGNSPLILELILILKFVTM